MPRLFTGLQLPEETSFVLSLKRGGLNGARWIDPENYHITLRYMGDIDGRTAAEVGEALDFVTGIEPFTLTLSHLGVFGGNKPRALYAGTDPSESLTRLQVSQERLLQRLGLEPDGRKFVPHVTLARMREATAADLARHIAHAGQFMPLSFTVDHFV